MAYREQRFTAQDGVSLYFRGYGDPGSAAMPLLCLSGLFRNARDFDLLAHRLSGERRVLCPNLRGAGGGRTMTRTGATTSLEPISATSPICLPSPMSIGSSWSEPRSAACWRCCSGRFMPLNLAGVVLNDVDPEVEQGRMDGVFAYISVDRPQGR